MEFGLYALYGIVNTRDSCSFSRYFYGSNTAAYRDFGDTGVIT